MIKAEKFGSINGRQITEYTLYAKGAEFSVIDYGATLTSVSVPDKNGRMTDVLLGYDTLEGYLKCGGYLGASVGRVANRVAGAKFSYGGREYRLFANNGENSLHGGKTGFDKRIWRSDVAGNSVIMTYHSEDGEEGYFGDLDVEVAFKIVEGTGVSITYTAFTSSESAVNLTNYAYFNLNGAGSGSILSHTMQINSTCITAIDGELIPNGDFIDVAGTPFDFVSPKKIGEDIEKQNAQLIFAGGYDHNFVLDGKGEDGLSAVTAGDASGIVMKTFTNQNGLQFDSGNGLSAVGKGGMKYGRREGFCLAAQSFPNALNVENFGSPVIRAGEVYRNEIVYAFSAP